MDCTGFTFTLPTADEDGGLSITADPADYQDGSKPPGEYTVEICGTVNEAVPQNSETCIPVKVTLVDPCDPPTSINVPDMANQVYYITNPSHPEY